MEYAQNLLENLKLEAETDLNNAARSYGESQCSATAPIFHSDPSVNSAMHNIIHIEKKIKALRLSTHFMLPEDDKLLLSLAEEESNCVLIQNQRTLDFLNMQNQHLQKEKNFYVSLVKRAESVNKKLDKLQHGESLQFHLTEIKKKHDLAGTVFNELRTELQDYLSTTFPNEDSTETTMQDLIEALTRELLENPGNPYVDLEEMSINLEDVQYLVRLGLISQHPDMIKIRLNDIRD